MSSASRDLGSARAGVSHWWAQRLTAAALVPLSIWFMVSLVGVFRSDYATVRAWIANPVDGGLLLLFLPLLFYHAWLGLRVIIEDYAAEGFEKICTLALVQVLVILVGGLAVYAVLRILFGAGA